MAPSRSNAQTIKNGTSSHKKNYIDICQIVNLEGHQNCCIGSKVTVIFADSVDFAYWWTKLVEFHREGSAPAAWAAGLFMSYEVALMEVSHFH